MALSYMFSAPFFSSCLSPMPSSSKGSVHGVSMCLSEVLSASVDNVEGSHSAHSPLPQKPIVIGCGSLGLDYLATVEGYPAPDSKIRSTDLKIQGGGNVGNSSTAAARLGLRPRIISKVSRDRSGELILEELKADGVDTSYIVVSETGTSPFTYIIVDTIGHTRTCIHTPGFPPMVPEELSPSTLDAALSGARIVYFDGRLPDIAINVAQEAVKRQLPILIDTERVRERINELLSLADYAVCSTNFAQEWTKVSTLMEALLEMAIRLPKLKFVIATLGASGSVMLERYDSNANSEESDPVRDINTVYRSLMEEIKSQSRVHPYALASKVTVLKSGYNEIRGRIIVGTAEEIPSNELIDTTGSGDAFVGSLIYSLCQGLSRERMLNLAAVVAGSNCRGLGARGGLPSHTDPRVLSLI